MLARVVRIGIAVAIRHPVLGPVAECEQQSAIEFAGALKSRTEYGRKYKRLPECYCTCRG